MQYRHAGLWVRAGAFALDYLLIFLYLLVVTVIGVTLNRLQPTWAQTVFATPLSSQFASFLLVTLPVSLYFALGEASPAEATWGKRRAGLRVVRTDGSRLSVGRSLARTVLKFIPWELAHTMIWQVQFAEPAAAPLINGGFILVWLLVGANIVSLLVRPTRQTLYDWLARTYVIYR